jgi:hypothetical protein
MLDVLFRGLAAFLTVKFCKILVIKSLDLDPDLDWIRIKLGLPQDWRPGTGSKMAKLNTFRNCML